MIVRILRRLSLAAITLLLATALLYTAVRLLPGSAAFDDLSASPRMVEEWKRSRHLDRSLPVGYAWWLGDVLRGDFGSSFAFATGEPVALLVRRAAPTSLALGSLGLGAALLAAVATGLLAARRPGGLFDRAWSAALYALYAAPTFWIAMLLQNFFARRLELLPPFGTGPWDPAEGRSSLAAAAPYWILPPVCLALGSLAFFFRFTRASVLNGAARPCNRSARARGLREGTILRHLLASAGLDLATLAGVLVPAVLGGSVVIESIFALPGLGRLFFLGAQLRDYPVVMGVGLVLIVATILGSALGDVLATLAEPRLRDPAGGRA
jgi:peptide/nickel transport system permease protein